MIENNNNKILNFISNPLLIGIFFSLYVIVIRFLIFPKYSIYLVEDSTLIQNFIEWFGVPYGLFIALVLVNVWSQFDTTKREFDREADAIFMLYQATKQIELMGKDKKDEGELIKGNIIKSIKDYVSHINKNYLIEHQKPKVRNDGDSILENIREHVGKLVHSSENDVINSELIKEFNEAIDMRGDRISHSKQGIPKPVWWISLASSILWLIPFYWLNFQDDWVAIILVGGVTVIVVAILVIIKDLDDPFDGTWKIDIVEWRLLGEKINLMPTLFFVYSIGSSGLYKMGAWFEKLFSKRLCALYSLLSKIEQRRFFLDELSELAYLEIYYKDEFENLYEKMDTLPAVIYKSGNTMKTIVNSAEINNITKLADLKKLIQDLLATLRSS